MRYLFILIIGLLISNCSTTQLVDNWKNPEIDTYEPQKVLVIGMTSNVKAREKFESMVVQNYDLRGVEAFRSVDVFDTSLLAQKMTEEDLLVLETNLVNEGYDTILFSKVVGSEDKIQFKEQFRNLNNMAGRFRDEYYIYQDMYYNPDYYKDYTVYHAETSMYCICPTKERELIWKGYIDIIDPESMEESVTDYTKLIMAVLEAQDLVGLKQVLN